MSGWKTRKSLIFALIMIGFTATGGQIIVVREFIIVFYGNELCLGLILANWLLWGAVGSWAMGRFADRIKRRYGVLAITEIILALLLPSIIFATRSARAILGTQPGELIGILPISVFTFIILAPMCGILGFLFSLGSRMYPSAKGAKQIGYVYILEGVGASTGGLLTSLILIRYFNSIQIAMFIGALNLASAVSLRTFLGHKRIVKVLFRGAIAAILALNIYLLFPAGDRSVNSIFTPFKADNLHRRSLLIQWGMLGLKESENSIYSNLTVVGNESGYSFYSNGLHMFTVPNQASAEPVAHFPMLEHPDPKKILLIGGGIGGSLGEILKYSVKEVDYVELDPKLIDLARKWLDDKFLNPLDDPRVKLSNVDGRLFVKRAQQKYDLVIVDLPEPFTAQLNRFYTKEFFSGVKRILTDKGILSLGVASSANYLSAEHQRFLNCIYKTLASVFPDIITIPADDQAFFMACMTQDVLTYDAEIISSRLRERNIESLYVSEYQIPSWLEPWRVKSFSQRVRAPQNVSINRDFRPVSYYYNMILWSTRFESGSFIQSKYKDLFIAASHLNLWWFLLPVFVAGTVFFIAGIWKQNVRLSYILLAVMVTGFAEITFEVIVSLGFQIIYGYMYYKLGLILTAFMIGLIMGSTIMNRIIDNLKRDLLIFTLTQIAVCIYPLILLVTFWLLMDGKSYFLGANVIFPVLPVIAGFIGGFQFPLATKIYLKHKTRVGRVAGLTYGVDLLGSCAGAFLVSAFLVPIIGIPNTCFAVVLLSIMILILLTQSNFYGDYKS
jgi:spermidine synthase